MTTIQHNIKFIHKLIHVAAKCCGRNPKEINLLIVSKNKSTMQINDAVNAGQRNFGENYVHEGVKKITWFREYIKDVKLTWHFIGHLQTNKSRLIAENFDWCHSIDQTKLVYRLNNQRPVDMVPLNVLIQINISEETKKYGIFPKNMMRLASAIYECPHLRLRGLMSISAFENNIARQLFLFRKINTLYNLLKLVYPNIDTLSIGMTNDMIAGIYSGSTMVRIGTAIFNDNQM